MKKLEGPENRTSNGTVLIELRALLRQLLAGGVPRLENLRQIERLRQLIEQRDEPDFFSIRAAVSDLDAVPDECRRQFFTERFLKEKDEESAAYLGAAAHDLRKDASALLQSSWLSMP